MMTMRRSSSVVMFLLIVITISSIFNSHDDGVYGVSINHRLQKQHHPKTSVVDSAVAYFRPDAVDTSTFTNGFVRCSYFVNHYDVNKQGSSKANETDSYKCPTCVHLGRRFVRMLREEYHASRNTTDAPLVFEKPLISISLRHFVRTWCSDVFKPHTTVGCCALAKSLSNEYSRDILQVFSEIPNATEANMCTKIKFCSSLTAAQQPMMTDPVSSQPLPTTPPTAPRVMPTPLPTPALQAVSQEELIRQASGIDH